jgi:hypothetical protein
MGIGPHGLAKKDSNLTGLVVDSVPQWRKVEEMLGRGRG